MHPRQSHKIHRKLYCSARWRRLRLRVFKRDNWQCVQCRKEGVFTPAAQVDHITPMTEEPVGFFEMDRLQSLCEECHKWKTANEVREAARAKRRVKWDIKTGMPLGLGHGKA